MVGEQTSTGWISKAADAFQVLGNEARLRLVLLLAQQMSGERYRLDELAQMLGAPASVISLHLGVLENAGIVHRDRRDGQVCYSLDRKGLLAYGDLIYDLLAKGAYLLA